MATEIALAEPVYLGPGRSIRPPAGWRQVGQVIDDPLWLLPKSRLRWMPPGLEIPILHWDLTMAPLERSVMDDLMRILDGLAVPLDRRILEPLYPALIRMPLATITDARVGGYAQSGRLLTVKYFFPEYGERGIVHYAPTEMYEYGETQILAYEGKGREFEEFLPAALSAMETFAVGQLPLPARAEPPLASVQAPPHEWWTESDGASEEDPGAGEPVGQPEASPPPPAASAALPVSAVPAFAVPATSFLVPPQPAARAPESARGVSDAQADTAVSTPSEPPAVIQPNGQSQPAAGMPPSEESPTSADPARVAGAAAAGQNAAAQNAAAQNAAAPARYTVHVVQAGETMRSVVKQSWPELGADELKERIREIYAFNLANGNPIQAWDIKPGTAIFLPRA